MNNFFLIEDPITRLDVEYIDDTLDSISDEIADKEAWNSFDDMDDWQEPDPEFEEAWQERSNLEDIVIMKTDISIEKVRDMSDEELNNVLNRIIK